MADATPRYRGPYRLVVHDSRGVVVVDDAYAERQAAQRAARRVIRTLYTGATATLRAANGVVLDRWRRYAYDAVRLPVSRV